MYHDSLIIGSGEVGSALQKVLDKRQNREKCGIIDKKDKDFKNRLKELKCKTLHICFPYTNSFLKDSLKYLNCFQPELLIIHSTVPVGTTEMISRLAYNIKSARTIHVVHSPIRGQHPNLEESLTLFVKYVGTENKEAYEQTKLEMSNMTLKWLNDSKETELGKILSTSYYGLCISWHREMKKMCDYFGVEFKNVVTDFNETYNAGYRKIRPKVIRPILSPPTNKIGGHCIVQNAKMLNKQKKSKFLELVK